MPEENEDPACLREGCGHTKTRHYQAAPPTSDSHCLVVNCDCSELLLPPEAGG